MKVSIVTPHAVYNYGAVLQAHALYNYLNQQKNCQALMQDFPPHTGGAPVGLREKLFSVANRVGRKLHAKEILLGEKRFDEFIDEFELTARINHPLYITGSDQVWNPANLDEHFSLDFVEKGSKKVSYAASMGVSVLPQKDEERFAKMAKGFDALSAREKQTADEITRVSGLPCSVEMDPTFLLSKEYWRTRQKAMDIKKPYILLYLLHIPENIQAVIKEAKKKYKCDVRIIDRTGFLRYSFPGVIGMGDVGPAEFLWLFDNAEFIITTSFHGTAFSLIFEKQFRSLINPAAPSRISNLLSMAGINPEGKEALDYQKIWENLNPHIEKSKGYLKNVLETTEDNSKNNVLYHSFECVGCTACKTICPTKAIVMKKNEEGFYEPEISDEKCVSCGKCVKVCPVLSPAEERMPLKQVAAINNDENVRYNSTSGGAFSGVADGILKNGGIVFGAVYNEDFSGAHHESTENVSIDVLRKSKYVVSDLRNSFEEVIEYAKSGKEVLFVGTPCQCAGLAPLVEKYPNVYLVDFICGGTPSEKAFNDYMRKKEKGAGSKIIAVDFRGKDTGWKKQYLSITYENGVNAQTFYLYDSYFTMFCVKHLSTRKACTNCKFRKRHMSDLTIADFWGYRATDIPVDDKGLSLVCINTPEGKKLWSGFSNKKEYTLTQDNIKYAFEYFSENKGKEKLKARFFNDLKKNDFSDICGKYCDTSKFGVFKVRILSKLGR